MKRTGRTSPLAEHVAELGPSLPSPHLQTCTHTHTRSLPLSPHPSGEKKNVHDGPQDYGPGGVKRLKKFRAEERSLPSGNEIGETQKDCLEEVPRESCTRSYFPTNSSCIALNTTRTPYPVPTPCLPSIRELKPTTLRFQEIEG